MNVTRMESRLLGLFSFAKKDKESEHRTEIAAFGGHALDAGVLTASSHERDTFMVMY